MNSYKHGNWYCKPANEAETKEIIKRAVSSGAKRDETLKDYWWSTYGAWGVYDGRTFTQRVNYYRDQNAAEYTIEQVREKFPLPGEQATEWNGEGLPPVGQRVEINMGNFHSDRRKDGEAGRVLSVSTNSNGRIMAMIEIDETDGECDAIAVDCLRPIRSERERWVESAVNMPSAHQWTAEAFAGVIYDAIKSGTLKAPEVK